MDKTVILFLIGLGLGIFVGNLSMPSDLAGLDNSGEEITVAATEIWLVIHYTVALITLPVLAIKYLKDRITPLKGLPFAFGAGFLCASVARGLINVLTQIFTT
jgi:hypothetical protein